MQDALAMVATEASVRVISRMMISGEVEGLHLHLWLSSLGMLQIVTENMLSEAKVGYIRLLMEVSEKERTNE